MTSSFFQNAHHFVSNADTLISAQSYHVHNTGDPSLGKAFQGKILAEVLLFDAMLILSTPNPELRL